MSINRIHGKNFKSFSEIDVDLTRFNVVIGSNAAGKSNFIGIFKFLRDIARHGIVNAIAMQGGVEYIRNAKIGTARDLVIKVYYQPDRTLEIVDGMGDGQSLLGLRACESTYEFALRFDGSIDGFTIVKDELVIGCEVTGCTRTGTIIHETAPVGRGFLTVSNQGGR